jgi:hypothetical protein
MSQPETQQTQQLRRSVRKTAERHDSISVAEVVSEVKNTTGAKEAAVLDVVDELERNGFVYLVGEGENAEKEVRVP